MASSGKAGALVVIIAIVGTILGGTALGSEEVSRTTMDYSFVSDVSGLYDYSDQPIYTQYNPSTNLTGFYRPGYNYTSGINFDAASSLSSYPIKQEQTPTTGTITLSASSTERFILQCKEYPYNDDSNAAFYYTVNQPYVQPFKTFLSGMIGSVDLDRIEIKAAKYTDFGPVIVRASAISQSPNNPSWTYCTWYPTLYNIDSYVFENSTQAFRALDSSGTVVWSANIEDIRVIWGGTVNNNTTGITASTLSNTMSYSLYEKLAPIYLDPTKGVEIQAGIGNVQWKNGYSNDSMSLFFIKDPTDSNYLYISIKTDAFESYNSLRLRVNTNSQGYGYLVELYKANINWDTGGINSSSWITSYVFNTDLPGLIVTIDAAKDQIRMTPAGPPTGSDKISFQNYQVYEAMSKTFDIKTLLSIDVPDVTSLWFITASTLRFTVIDTSVFMDTYINVIYDQTFDISEYFPNNDMYYKRLDLKSFAIYGDSMEINKKLFSGLNDGYIDIVDVTGKSKTLLLDNISLFNGTDNHLYLLFNNDGTLVDLDVFQYWNIIFEGAWYMSTDLYSGKQITTSGYEFSPMQWAFENNNVAIIFYLGLLAFCSIVAARYTNFGWGDIILVSCAGIVGFLLLV